MFMSGTAFPSARFPEFSSLSTLTQAVLEMIAPLLSDWPAWHSKGASSSSWAFSIWRWYCPAKETDREINHLCDTLCYDKDVLVKNMFKKKKKKQSQSLAELFTRRCLGADEHLLQAPISFMLIFNGIWIMGNFQLRKFVKINNKRSLFGGKLVFQFQDGDIICCFLGCLIWLKIGYFRNLVKWKHLTRWEPPLPAFLLACKRLSILVAAAFCFRMNFPGSQHRLNKLPINWCQAEPHLSAPPFW